MPRFAANLSMMFTEVPFIERFAAARKAGFDAGDYPPFPDVSTKHTQTSTWHWNMHWRSIVNKSM